MAQFGGYDFEDVLVTPERLITAANEIGPHADKIKSDFEELTKIVAGMGATWDGEAHEKFKTYYENRQGDIDKIGENLGKIQSVLLEMAGVYQDTEQRNEQVAQVLPSDIIF